MANVYCVFLKFCVFCLIFVELSQSNEINSDLYNYYKVEYPHSLKYLDNVEHRLKRDTNESQTSSTAAVATTPTVSAQTQDINNKKVDASTTPVVAPDNTASPPHLFGENGHGQRHDYNTSTTGVDNNNTNIVTKGTTTTILGSTSAGTESQNTDNNKATINKSLCIPESGAAAGKSSDLDDLIGCIDEPEEAINQTISDHHFANETRKVDYFQYYNSSLIVDKNQSDEYWSAKKDYIVSNILSKSHRRAITVQLKFDFPFYGHIVRNVTVASGGFLYTGEYVHSWLAATQYIAPLMANFDTSTSNVSTVKYADNGTSFTVIWEKVPLQDSDPTKAPIFTFSVTLYNTGDITFAYKTIPIAIEMIKDEKHPVKIGLSDAYIIDKTIYFARRKTIYEYHRVNFNGQDISNDTLITLKALPTCLEHTDCAACLDANLEAFNCTWCPTLNRCSTGTDRRRQEWMQNGCERTQLKDTKVCPALGTKGNNYASQQQVITATPTHPSTSYQQQNEQSFSNGDEINKTANKAASSSSKSDANKSALALGIDNRNNNDRPKHSHASFALGILLPIVVIASLVLWVFYAYRNPHTKSGQLLIQYRPSTWSWRRGEARYTAATIHM